MTILDGPTTSLDDIEALDDSEEQTSELESNDAMEEIIMVVDSDEEAAAPRPLRMRNRLVSEKIAILDVFAAKEIIETKSKTKFTAWVSREYNRPIFGKKEFNRWLKNEAKLREVGESTHVASRARSGFLLFVL